ncbi:MAG: GH116 family glycosyl hydrolase [Anaerolineales bacterium]|jgi:uncharacterized protein (DUF608 family)
MPPKSNHTNFPPNLPDRQWVKFSAKGFSQPVVGVVYRDGGSGQCGLPLGGIGTGYINIDPNGCMGEWTIYNNLVNPARTVKNIFAPNPIGIPRVVNTPFLGLSIEDQCWLLTLQEIEGVNSAHQIHYWGHYPVADLEYEIEAPLGVSLRAWSPFIPGDALNSNVPGAVFEIQIKNQTETGQRGKIIFNFPGPCEYETRGPTDFQHQYIEDAFTGLAVTAYRPGWPAIEQQLGGRAPFGYALGIAGQETICWGRDLGTNSDLWTQAMDSLPAIKSSEPGASVAVEFALEAHEVKRITFVLAWYAPYWPETRYINMYRLRWNSALEVAQFLVSEQESLLNRMLAWQQTVYSEQDLPGFLRDSLVNSLHTLTKGSFFVCNPGADIQNGLLTILEAAGDIDIKESMCVAWWGDFPITYFFPNLRLTTLRAFAAYQLDDGMVPFSVSSYQDHTLNAPHYYAQQVVNGMLYIQMVDRLCQRIQNDQLIREFYPTVKRAIIFTMSRSVFEDGLVGLDPEYPKGQTWDSWMWYGNATYIAGQWLCSLKVAERMADLVGDVEFGRNCKEWFELASQSLEETLCNEKTQSYLLYNDPVTNQCTDTVFSYQLDGEFSRMLLDLPEVFPEIRVSAVLETIKKLCVEPVKAGAANAMRPDGSVDPAGGKDSSGIWPSANFVLAANYAYHDKQGTAVEIARKTLNNLVLKHQLTWNFPQAFAKLDGTEAFARNYYWGMAVWSLPPALKGQDLARFCSPGSFVDWVISAGHQTGQINEPI